MRRVKILIFLASSPGKKKKEKKAERKKIKTTRTAESLGIKGRLLIS